MKISVLMTCHNRISKTLECLAAVYACLSLPDASIDVVLVDDGSTDGTSDEVARLYPDVVLHRGDGSLFWNRGMHEAQVIALRRDPDYILWLNDDTLLLPGALGRLLETSREVERQTGRPAVIVGSCADRETGTLTYGGAVSRSRLRRFTYAKVWSETSPVECEVMNGNVVLIPRAIVDAVGNIDHGFEHAMGDTDYALRARLAGFRIYVAPGMTGYCCVNPRPVVDYDSPHSLSEKWAAFTSRKRLPLKSWLRFTQRHGGFLWPAYFAQPYARFLVRALRASIVRHGS